MITTTQTKSISRSARRKQKSKSLDVSIQELYEMYKVADVKLSAQRYKESISKNSIITFAYRVIDGLIHQNLTLANIKQCFSNTRDPRWIEKLGSNKPILNFLILDGQHRMEMINTIMGNPYEYLKTEEEFLDFKKSTLSVRFIESMNFASLGDTFIANNCGKPISAQDQLTFLDTDVSNYIVTKTLDNWNIIGSVFSNPKNISNSGRKLDKEVRCSAMAFSDNPGYIFEWSFTKAKEFYKNGTIHTFTTALDNWIDCLRFLGGNSRRRNAQGLRLFIAILQNPLQDNRFNVLNPKSLVEEFKNWEQNRYNSKEEIKYTKSKNNKSVPYKELCSTHSSAELITRGKIIQDEFFIPNRDKWLKNKIISRK